MRTKEVRVCKDYKATGCIDLDVYMVDGKMELAGWEVQMSHSQRFFNFCFLRVCRRGSWCHLSLSLVLSPHLFSDIRNITRKLCKRLNDVHT